MSFLELLKNETISEEIFEISSEVSEVFSEKEKTPEAVLRRNNFKIKLVTPTSFGTQIDFAKEYEEQIIKDSLKDFNFKIKGKSVFIIK